MSAPLLRRPLRANPDGVVQRITPSGAGWQFVGFEAIDLPAGGELRRTDPQNELCLVMLSGTADVSAGGMAFGTIGGRSSVFEPNPWSVYLPPHAELVVRAHGPVELALCASPASGKYPPRLIPPEQVGELTRGSGTNTRFVRNILPDTAEAETLLVVEVVTPGGHWSSYPPHKHDTASETETYLEETYYHRLRRGSGFALQRVYTDDRSLDETMAVSDRDVVLVPRGYHPVGAPHGFDLYYLNVMAGPDRRWKFTMAPEHAHLPY